MLIATGVNVVVDNAMTQSGLSKTDISLTKLDSAVTEKSVGASSGAVTVNRDKSLIVDV